MVMPNHVRGRRPSRLGASLLVCAGVLAATLAGCGTSDDDADGERTDEVDASDDAADAAETDPSGEVGTGPAEVEADDAEPRIAIPGVDDGVVLLTAAHGGGAWPTLAWEPVAGADTYTVTVYSASGRAYWTWRGEASEVIVGGFDEQPRDGSPVGPRIHEPMSWDVLAHDAAGRIVAQSGERPIAP